METLQKVQKGLFLSIIAAYLVFVACTFAGLNVSVLFLSLTITVLCFVLIYTGAYQVKEYSTHMMLLGVGILFWSIGDAFRITESFTGAALPGDLASLFYIFPNYFFGLSLIVYLHRKLNKRTRAQLIYSAFALTIVGFVLLRKLLKFLAAGITLSFFSYCRVLFYFFINCFILMTLVFFMQLVRGISLKKGTCFVPIGIFCYILLDFQYNYKENLGQDPENPYMDLLYVLFLIMIAYGTYSQSKYSYSFKVKSYEHSARHMRTTMFTVIGACVLDGILYFVSFFEANEFFYILLAVLAYWIMATTYDNNMLDEALLKNQKEQNALLEKQVEEKTKDLKYAYENLQKLSSTDILTGIYNRRYNAMFIRDLTADCLKTGERYAVFCIDLNHFKPINDTYGHDMGDRVLSEFGQRMLKLPKNQTAFRTGGDEFMVVMTSVINKKDVEQAADNLQKLFNRPVELDTYSFNLSGSIGIALFPEDSDDPSLIISYADAAMYAVKKSPMRDSYRFFDKGLVASVERHRKLEDIMHTAIPEKDFVLHFQPIVSMEDGALMGAEVFPRLKLDDDFEYSPSELIPIAEECGLMGALGKWIVSETLTHFSEWQKKYGEYLRISINLSALQLLDTEFMKYMQEAVSQTGYPKNRFALDISTNVMLSAENTTKETLISLEKAGFPLCINDFGGCELKLSNFLDCKFTVIKLSPSLIRQAESHKVMTLIRSIHAMASCLDTKTCAVGVETKKQATTMRDVGINYAQGYYYGKPCPAEDFEKSYLKGNS